LAVYSMILPRYYFTSNKHSSRKERPHLINPCFLFRLLSDLEG